eukprot:g4358.t1
MEASIKWKEKAMELRKQEKLNEARVFAIAASALTMHLLVGVSESNGHALIAITEQMKTSLETLPKVHPFQMARDSVNEFRYEDATGVRKLSMQVKNFDKVLNKLETKLHGVKVGGGDKDSNSSNSTGVSTQPTSNSNTEMGEAKKSEKIAKVAKVAKVVDFRNILNDKLIKAQQLIHQQKSKAIDEHKQS